ncbi:MAG TPA: hypothetical protein VF299_07145 [Mycobacterium sp.]
MTLSLADIDRWDPDAITAVFQAAISRAQGTRTAAASIGQTMASLDWGGEAGEAARTAAVRTMIDLDNDADVCEAVAWAAQSAAGEVSGIKSRLARIRATAGIYHLSIGDQTGAVSLPADLSSYSQADQREIREAQPRVAAAIKHVLSDAAVADEDLAAAIRGADGELSPEQVNAEVASHHGIDGGAGGWLDVGGGAGGWPDVGGAEGIPDADGSAGASPDWGGTTGMAGTDGQTGGSSHLGGPEVLREGDGGAGGVWSAPVFSDRQPAAPKVRTRTPKLYTKWGNVGDGINNASNAASLWFVDPEAGFAKSGGAALSDNLQRLSRLGRGMGATGTVLTAANGVTEGVGDVRNGVPVAEALVDVAPKTIGSVVGGWEGAGIGADAGLEFGAFLGSFIPVPVAGTAIGAVVGAGAGALIGGLAGSAAGNSVGGAFSSAWHGLFG